MSKNKEFKYHLSEEGLIASLLESLSSIVFSETKEEKQKYIDALELKLQILQPKALINEQNEYLCLLIMLISSFIGLDDYMAKNMQMLRMKGYEVTLKHDLSTFEQNEYNLMNICEKILAPLILCLNVDIESGFVEMDGLRNQLLLQDGVYV